MISKIKGPMTILALILNTLACICASIMIAAKLMPIMGAWVVIVAFPLALAATAPVATCGAGRVEGYRNGWSEGYEEATNDCT